MAPTGMDNSGPFSPLKVLSFFGGVVFVSLIFSKRHR